MPALTLLAYLGQQVSAPIIRKGLFEGEYVFFGEYMAVSLYLYETSAILGYTFRDRITSFVSLFCQPGREKELSTCLGKPVATKLAALGHEPKNFLEFYFVPETARLMRVMRDAGTTTYSDWLDFPKVAKQKLPASKIWSQLQFTAAEGVGLGCCHPQLAEKFFAYEDNPKTWEEFRSHGLDIPASPPKARSIEQRQTEALALIKPYVAHVRPDLVEALGL